MKINHVKQTKLLTFMMRKEIELTDKCGATELGVEWYEKLLLACMYVNPCNKTKNA